MHLHGTSGSAHAPNDAACEPDGVPGAGTPASHPTRPLSATTTWVNWVAVASLAITLLAARHTGVSNSAALIVASMLSIAVPVAVLEAWTRGPALPVRPRRRDSGRLRRCFIKVVGLIGSLGVLGLSYWIAPYFREGDASLVYEVFAFTAVPAAVVVPWYVTYVDARMEDPYDEYYAAGMFFLGRYRHTNKTKLAEHARAWLVKIFFFQYITSVFVPYLTWFTTADLWQQFTAPDFGFMNVLIDTVWMIDVAFSCVGYFATFRLLGSHVRSTDSTMLGWAACMACYGPFYAMLMSSWIPYEDGLYWGHWLAPWPLGKAIWAVMIAACLFLYCSASVQFGLRFSNMTHRGIITSGPFSLTKHPQYISKNIAWWLISIPFIHNEGLAEAFRHCAMLLMFNYVYYLRARTEERHLSRDPVYRQYALWISRYGIVARTQLALVRLLQRQR